MGYQKKEVISVKSYFLSVIVGAKRIDA